MLAALRRLLGQPPAGAAPQEREIEAGIARHEAGDAAGALAAFRSVIAAAPGHARAHALAGVAQLSLGETDEAETLIRRSLALDPKPHLAWFNLGAVLLTAGRPAEAAAALEQARARDPGHFATLFNLGRANLDCGRFDAAIAAAEQLVARAPGDAAALVELGTMHYRKAGATLLIAEFDAAIDCLQRALDSPDLPEAAHHNARLFLGDALGRRGRHSEALAFFRALQAAAPDDPDANVQLANCLNALGRIRAAAPYYDAVVRLTPGHLPAVSSAISAADYDPVPDARQAAARRFALAALFADPARHSHWDNPPQPERRLRLGYVSPDLRRHVAMTLFAGVLERHDRAAFEVFVYDATTQRDALNASLRRHADHWREIDTLDTAAACALIRADAIDVLVDLAGHTAGNRLMLFARKPAPVQATWLAYPGSTGLASIDYIVTDPVTTPPGSESLYAETPWRLPRTRFCFSPPAASPEPRLPAGDAPVFGCFNNPSKLNPAVLALWRRILEAVPDSRLLVKYMALDDASGRAALADELGQAGIPLARVEMRGYSDYVQALGEYGEVDVALDPFPFCGGLTSLDALWMGVPVVTLSQAAMAGRQTEAFLATIGHPELVAHDADRYVNLAACLARDRARLARYRATLRADLAASPLSDYDGFTRELEAAWRGMWQRFCAARASGP